MGRSKFRHTARILSALRIAVTALTLTGCSKFTTPFHAGEGLSSDSDRAVLQSLRTRVRSSCDPSLTGTSTLIRRLNKREYNNTTRDLLGTTIAAGDILPSDDIQDNFDNVDSALRFTQAHADRFVEAAETLADSADLSTLVTCDITAVSCVRGFIDSFSKRAFRTNAAPWTADQIEALIAIYNQGVTNENADRGIRLIIQAVLSDARFLFKIDRLDGNGRLTGDSMASRLSYFLWSSLPDARLMADAANLQRPSVLQSEVNRMLADPKAGAFLQNFVGLWLDTNKVTSISKNTLTYPAFADAQLRADLQTETQLFIKELITANRPVAELLTANYTFLNANLAAFYGIPGVTGTDFRKVSLSSASGRAGILMQGSVLAANSGPMNTSPVKRGKSVLDRVLCSPPAPPPPGAGVLSQNLETSNLTKREMFAQHGQSPVCASCHKVMEPIGFGFENFDVTGKWRTIDERGDSVDPAGVLATGISFSDQFQLVRALAGDARVDLCVAKNLATFSLDRSVSTDRETCHLQEIASDVMAKRLGFRDLIVRLAIDDMFAW